MTIVTEKEASEKWCPYANVYVAYQGTGAAGNRGLSPSDQVQGSAKHANCIGSRCMAWRKDHTADYDKFGNLPGYCGAFGRVESHEL